MIWLILIVALLIPYYYAKYEAKGDYKSILEDKLDSLKQSFHKGNLIERTSVAVIVTALVVSPLHAYGFSYFFALPYFLYFTAVFGYTFTTKLNTLRGRNTWYVSRALNAPKLDQFIVMTVLHSKSFNMTAERFSCLLHTWGLVVAILILIFAVYLNL